MKITVGVYSQNEIVWFLENGADRICLGLDALENDGRFSNVPKLEPAGVKYIARLVHSVGKKLFIYCNEIVPDFKPGVAIMQFLHQECGADGFIIANETQVELYPKKSIMPIWILGILGFCFNSAAAAYYKSYGISWLTVPTSLRPNEAKGILKLFPESEFYYPIYGWCKNIDGLCYGCAREGIRFCARSFSSPLGAIKFPDCSMKSRLDDFYDCVHMDVCMRIPRVFGGVKHKRLMFDEIKALNYLAKNMSKQRFQLEGEKLLVLDFWPRWKKLI